LAHPTVTKSKSPIRWHITRRQSPKTSNSPPRVTTVKDPVVSVAHGMKGKWGNPKYALKDKGVIDSRCSWHMTGNMSYLSKFKELNGGYVAFRGNPKGGEISGKGSGPIWLFDIDSLTRTMNYQPVNTRNQTNPSVGFQDKFDAEKAGEEVAQQYVLFLAWSSGSTNPQNNDEDAAFDEKEHDAKKPESEVNVFPSSSAQLGKQDDKTKKKAKGKSLVESSIGYRHLSAEFEDCSENSSNEVNAAGFIVPTVGPTHGKSSFNDASQPTDDSDITELEDITYSDDDNDVGAEADFNNLETSITVSPIPTTRIHKDHYVSQIIGDLSLTIQTRSMTRVVKDQEVFALVARIKAIRLFLAYASFMGFMVCQMDVKSAFLYGTIEKEVYVCQPLGFEEPDHPDKIYKVVKKKGHILLVQIYVDDIIFGATNKDLCRSFEKLMKDKFQMSSMGELTFFLGLQ
nr:hypothetical protein [Tanacetum cinerariifolium]